jgi:hypothetical protein
LIIVFLLLFHFSIKKRHFKEASEEEKKAEENRDGQAELVESNQNSKSEGNSQKSTENTKLPWKKRKLNS